MWAQKLCNCSFLLLACLKKVILLLKISLQKFSISFQKCSTQASFPFPRLLLSAPLCPFARLLPALKSYIQYITDRLPSPNFLAVQEAFSRHANTFFRIFVGKNEIKYHKEKDSGNGRALLLWFWVDSKVQEDEVPFEGRA